MLLFCEEQLLWSVVGSAAIYPSLLGFNSPLILDYYRGSVHHGVIGERDGCGALQQLWEP